MVTTIGDNDVKLTCKKKFSANLKSGSVIGNERFRFICLRSLTRENLNPLIGDSEREGSFWTMYFGLLA